MSPCAGRFAEPQCFLFEATGLLDDRDPSLASLNNPVVEVEGQTLTVSGLSVRFGINVRCQLAAVVLFTIANGNGNFIRDGWTQVRDPSRGSFLTSDPLADCVFLLVHFRRSLRSTRLSFSTRCFRCPCCRWRTSSAARR